MAPHLFAHRRARGVPPSITARGLPIESGLRHGKEQYHLIDDEAVAEKILEYDANRDGPALFRHLPPEELEDTLESATEAVAAIEDGEVDDILDLLLVAERKEYGGRVTVIQAIEARNRTVVEQRSQTGDDVTTIQPEDIVTTT